VDVRTPLQFGLRFAVLFAALVSGFEATRGTAFEKSVVEDLILAPTTSLINTAFPDEHVELRGRTLTSAGGANLHVTRGCEGIELFFLLLAALLAFPATMTHRLKGFLVGSVVAYLLSVSRLIALHFILRYSPWAWEMLHGLVLPLGPILVMAVYFLHWSSVATRAAASNARAT
jgi:exosortase family protein XrtM